MARLAMNAAEADSLVDKIGTTELLYGLIAAVVEKLRVLAASEYLDGGKIPVRLFCNVLHAIKADNPDFAKELKYVDFRRAGDNWSSNALERILFVGGAWGLHQVPNPALHAITLPAQQAKDRLIELGTDCGEEGLARLDAMATEVASQLWDALHETPG